MSLHHRLTVAACCAALVGACSDPAGNSRPGAGDPAVSQELTELLDEVSGDAPLETQDRAEQRAAEAQRYAERIEAAITELEAFREEAAPTDLAQLDAALDRISGWAGLSEASQSRELTADQESRRQVFRQRLAAAQAHQLPRLRAAYDDLLAASTEQGSCRASGRGARIISCEAAPFEREQRVRSFHSQNRHRLFRLRFSQARYRSADMREAQYYSYSLDVPADGDIVIWTDITAHRPAG